MTEKNDSQRALFALDHRAERWGIIFLIGTWVWSVFFGFPYPWFLGAITLVAGVSFIDDIRSLPDSVRLVVQFAAMGLMFYQLGIFTADMWRIIFASADSLCRCFKCHQFYGWHQCHHGRIRNGISHPPVSA